MVGDIYKKDGCNHNSCEFKEIKDKFKDNIDLLIILNRKFVTWLYLSEINGAGVFWYHFKFFWQTDSRDFSYILFPIIDELKQST